MGIALGRLAIALGRGRAGYNQGRAQREQTEFENERDLAREQQQREYQNAIVATQRQQAQSLADQRAAELARTTAQDRLAAEMRRRRLAALQARGVNPQEADALADDETAFRQTMNPTPRPIDRLSDEGIEAQKKIAAYEASLRPQGGGGQQQLPKPKPVSEAKGSELAVTQGLLKMGADLRDEFAAFVGKGQNVTGPVRGTVGAGIRQLLRREPGEFVNARARLANLGSELMKARSGGAITPQEFERLAPFIPSAKDDEVTIQDKLSGFVQALAAIQQEKLEGLEDIGRDVGQLKGRYDPEIGSVLERSRVPSVRTKGQRTGTATAGGDTAIDPVAQQRVEYDEAAAILKARGQNPVKILGPRP